MNEVTKTADVVEHVHLVMVCDDISGELSPAISLRVAQQKEENDPEIRCHHFLVDFCKLI